MSTRTLDFKESYIKKYVENNTLEFKDHIVSNLYYLYNNTDNLYIFSRSDIYILSNKLLNSKTLDNILILSDFFEYISLYTPYFSLEACIKFALVTCIDHDYIRKLNKKLLDANIPLGSISNDKFVQILDNKDPNDLEENHSDIFIIRLNNFVSKKILNISLTEKDIVTTTNYTKMLNFILSEFYLLKFDEDTIFDYTLIPNLEIFKKLASILFIYTYCKIGPHVIKHYIINTKYLSVDTPIELTSINFVKDMDYFYKIDLELDSLHVLPLYVLHVYLLLLMYMKNLLILDANYIIQIIIEYLNSEESIMTNFIEGDSYLSTIQSIKDIFSMNKEDILEEIFRISVGVVYKVYLHIYLYYLNYLYISITKYGLSSKSLGYLMRIKHALLRFFNNTLFVIHSNEFGFVSTEEISFEFIKTVLYAYITSKNKELEIYLQYWLNKPKELKEVCLYIYTKLKTSIDLTLLIHSRELVIYIIKYFNTYLNLDLIYTNPEFLQNRYPILTEKGYYILNSLGSGGYGGVYLAVKKDKLYAVKILAKLPWFDNETRILTKLEPICAEYFICLTEHFKNNGNEYIIVEYYKDFEELTKYSDKFNKSPYFLVKVLNNIYNAIVELRKLGIRHNDLKPSNILMNELGQIKIIDYGSACEIDMACGSLPCTDFYVYPVYKKIKYLVEQYPKLEYSISIMNRQDFWSLGAICYEYTSILKMYFMQKSEDLTYNFNDDPNKNDILAKLNKGITQYESEGYINHINLEDLLQINLTDYTELLKYLEY